MLWWSLEIVLILIVGADRDMLLKEKAQGHAKWY